MAAGGAYNSRLPSGSCPRWGWGVGEHAAGACICSPLAEPGPAAAPPRGAAQGWRTPPHACMQLTAQRPAPTRAACMPLQQQPAPPAPPGDGGALQRWQALGPPPSVQLMPGAAGACICRLLAEPSTAADPPRGAGEWLCQASPDALRGCRAKSGASLGAQWGASGRAMGGAKAVAHALVGPRGRALMQRSFFVRHTQQDAAFGV